MSGSTDRPVAYPDVRRQDDCPPELWQQCRRACMGAVLCVALLVVGRCGAAAPDNLGAVTVQLAGEELAAAVPRIGDAAGAKLAVDRTLADHRIFLFVHKQSLGTIRRQLQEFVPTP